MSTVTMAMDYLHTRAPPYITITITITIIIGLLSTRIHCVTDNDGYTDCSSRRFKLLEGAGHCGYFSVVPLEGAGGAAVGVEEGDSVLAACLQGCVQDEGCGMIALQYPQLSNYDDEDDDYVCYGSNGSGRLVVKSSTNIKMYRNYGVGGNNTNVATTAAACPSPFGALSDPCLQGGCYYVPDDVAGNRTSLTSAEVTCQSLDTRAHVIHTETEQEVTSLGAVMVSLGVTSLWLGIEDHFTDNIPRFIVPGEMPPDLWLYNKNPGEDCTYLSGGTFYSAQCNSQHSFICEIIV